MRAISWSSFVRAASAMIMGASMGIDRRSAISSSRQAHGRRETQVLPVGLGEQEKHGVRAHRVRHVLDDRVRDAGWLGGAEQRGTDRTGELAHAQVESAASAKLSMAMSALSSQGWHRR